MLMEDLTKDGVLGNVSFSTFHANVFRNSNAVYKILVISISEEQKGVK